MKALSLLINPQTGQLRSPWRLGFFLALIAVPGMLVSLFAGPSPVSQPKILGISSVTVVVYMFRIAWALVVSWLCLITLDNQPFASLGWLPHRGWLRDSLVGLVISFVMMTLVVGLQTFSGGTELGLNRSWSGEVLTSVLLFAVAASYEEIIYRGYTLQTLLRSLPPAWPLVLVALLFGLAHLRNPFSSPLATLNTTLAGIWLGVAYLRTRSLWLPTALHFGWNWTMGTLYGLPVSGLHISTGALLVAHNGQPEWWTGGDYGPEGGVATTLVLVAATIFIWRSRWLGGLRQEVVAKADEKNILR